LKGNIKPAQMSREKIVRLIEKGVIVELPMGVDGFIPLSQLSQTPVRNIAESFKVGDTLPLRVIEFEKKAKKSFSPHLNIWAARTETRR